MTNRFLLVRRCARYFTCLEHPRTPLGDPPSRVSARVSKPAPPRRFPCRYANSCPPREKSVSLNTLLRNRAALKLQPKMILLKIFFLPRFLHQLNFDRNRDGELVKWDKTVRQWLRLPVDSPNSTIHATGRFGGSGINTIEMLNTTLKVSSLRQLSFGDDVWWRLNIRDQLTAPERACWKTSVNGWIPGT